MLAANEMLDSLLRDTDEPYEYHNDDANFGTVLEECQDGDLIGKKIRYSDGTEKVFSFDN